MHAPARTPGRCEMRGFTLIELMVVVMLLAILSAIAMPAFRTMVATQRIRSAASALTESLWLARAEATKRNTDIAFVFSGAAAPWRIADPAGGATPLLVQDGFPSVVSRTQSGADVQFAFNAYGRLTQGSGWIELSDSSQSVHRCISISTTGRSTVVNGACQ